MKLIKLNGVIKQEVFIYHILQPEKSRRFVPAYIAQIIRAATPQCHRFGIGIFLNVHFIKCAVIVVLHPKNNRTGQFIVFYQFNKSELINFFSSSDNLFGAIIINMLDDMG